MFNLTLFTEEKSTAYNKVTNVYHRPNIVDRNNLILATNLSTASIYANPKKISNIEKTASAIVSIFKDLNYSDIYKLLSSNRNFVWVKHHITPKEQLFVKDLNLPGINLQKSEKRVYPHGTLFSHILGYVDPSGKGLAGIEKYIDNQEKGAEYLKLSVDVRVQNIVRNELMHQIQLNSAAGGVGIVLSTKEGEIISMTSLPDFDPHHYNKVTDQQKFNRATLGVYELGSIFEIFTIAAAIDSGKVGIDDVYDVSKPIATGKYTIKDYHKSQKPELTVQEIFSQSSNIGMAKIAVKIGKEILIKYLEKMGLFSHMNIEIPEKSRPLIPKKWYDSTLITVSYGYGLAITPLHISQSTAALVNGGIMYPATLIKGKNDTIVEAQRVISEKTSSTMRKLLRVAVKRGTGKKAEATGYVVGGKTGSAEKIVNGKYQKDMNISSFVAAFPISNPKYVVFIMIDTPQHNNSTEQMTGGAIAAPVVKNIINRIAPILNISPQIQLSHSK